MEARSKKEVKRLKSGGHKEKRGQKLEAKIKEAKKRPKGPKIGGQRRTKRPKT